MAIAHGTTHTTAQATVSIDAPLDLVWSAMLDLGGYGGWNPFILRVDAPPDRPPRVGDEITLHVRFGGGRRVASRERITAIEAPSPVDGGVRARLEYEFYGRLHATGMVRGSRSQLLTQRPGESTVYSTSERFRGLLAFIVPTKAVRHGFRRHAAALKAHAEALAAGAESG